MSRSSPCGSSHVACSASGRPSQSSATTGPQRVARVSMRTGSPPATAISATARRERLVAVGRQIAIRIGGIDLDDDPVALVGVADRRAPRDVVARADQHAGQARNADAAQRARRPFELDAIEDVRQPQAQVRIVRDERAALRAARRIDGPVVRRGSRRAAARRAARRRADERAAGAGRRRRARDRQRHVAARRIVRRRSRARADRSATSTASRTRRAAAGSTACMTPCARSYESLFESIV